MREMTITEGLSQLNLIIDRMEKNNKEIRTYSSLLSNEKPYFDTEAKQREELNKLIQSNHDLEKEYARIKSMIDFTNLVTMVNINGDIRSIHGWLTITRKTGKLLFDTYKSLDESTATQKQLRFKDSSGNFPNVIRLYDENTKRQGQKKWEDLTGGKQIISRLEVVNATTTLKICPVD